MFILRRVKSETSQVFNKSIGDQYQIIHKIRNEKAFNANTLIQNHNPDHLDDIFAIILFVEKGYEDTWPLFHGYDYYIMTEGGKTFEAI